MSDSETPSGQDLVEAMTAFTVWSGMSRRAHEQVEVEELEVLARALLARIVAQVRGNRGAIPVSLNDVTAIIDAVAQLHLRLSKGRDWRTAAAPFDDADELPFGL